MANCAKAVRAGTNQSGPFLAFKQPENSLLTKPAMLKLQKRPQDRVGVFAALQERGIAFDPTTPLQEDLKKLLLADAPGSHAPTGGQSAVRAVCRCPTLEVAHAEADGEL